MTIASIGGLPAGKYVVVSDGIPAKTADGSYSSNFTVISNGSMAVITPILNNPPNKGGGLY